MKFSNTGFFNKCDQIRRKLRTWSYLPKKSLRENFIFCAVLVLVFKDAESRSSRTIIHDFFEIFISKFFKTENFFCHKYFNVRFSPVRTHQKTPPNSTKFTNRRYILFKQLQRWQKSENICKFY